MAILPLRQLGTVGALPDLEPYNLPPQAYSKANNVVFQAGKAKRAPIFKMVYGTQGQDVNILGGISQTSTSGLDRFYLIDDLLNISYWQQGSWVAATSNTYSTTKGALPTTYIATTTSSLGDVIYFNQEDSTPLYKLKGETYFRELYPKAGAPSSPTSTWGSSTELWKCKALRPFKNFMIAMGMTEGQNDYESRVRWSDPVEQGQPSVDWDATDTTKSAGFNDLAQLDTPLVDGLPLGNSFILYSKNQTWLMDFVGGTFIFNFRRLFSNTGMVNTNCGVEVDGNHYVFAKDDIYVHNGTQKRSIAEGRVRNFIFKNLDTKNFTKCFVHHDVRFKKILFCYKSDDSQAKYSESTEANRAAVYSYTDDTWSFMDLPNVKCALLGNLSNPLTYANANATYETVGGTYQDAEGTFDRHSMFLTRINRSPLGISNSDASYPATGANVSHELERDYLIALDDPGDEAVAYPYAANINNTALLERVGIDLDESGQSLSSYKNITKIYPQVVSRTGSNVLLSAGASDTPNQQLTYTSSYTFNPEVDYQFDVRASGRYLGYKLETAYGSDSFELTGFDAEFVSTAKR